MLGCPAPSPPSCLAACPLLMHPACHHPRCHAATSQGPHQNPLDVEVMPFYSFILICIYSKGRVSTKEIFQLLVHSPYAYTSRRWASQSQGPDLAPGSRAPRPGACTAPAEAVRWQEPGLEAEQASEKGCECPGSPSALPLGQALEFLKLRPKGASFLCDRSVPGVVSSRKWAGTELPAGHQIGSLGGHTAFC